MSATDKRNAKRKEFRDYLNTTLIGGFLVILPVAILLIVFKWLFNILFGIIAPITSVLTFGGRIDQFLASILALSIIILICFGLGVAMRTALGNYLYQQFDDHVLSRIPFYKPIRDTVRQFSDREKMPFTKVVMVNVFNSDTLMTGFITDEHNRDYYTVFAPTGPNPTNGFVFHVKASQVTILDISVEEAMKSIISVGAGSKNIVESYFRES
jgi:uncharacterized membrane protein